MRIMSKKVVVQKCIELPLLYEKRKFDMPFYFVVIQSFRVYAFREMYIRVSSHPNDLGSLRKFGHLNNIALQKYSPNYDGEKAIITPGALEALVPEGPDPDGAPTPGVLDDLLDPNAVAEGAVGQLDLLGKEEIVEQLLQIGLLLDLVKFLAVQPAPFCPGDLLGVFTRNADDPSFKSIRKDLPLNLLQVFPGVG